MRPLDGAREPERRRRTAGRAREPGRTTLATERAARGAFHRRDWLANGALFAVYHRHVPHVIPATLPDTLIIAHPARRYRSALIGTAAHSAQSVFFRALVLWSVLKR